MAHKECCVISKSNHLILSQKEKAVRCQFSNELNAEFDFENDYFCILHLPIESNQKAELSKAIDSTIINLMNIGHTNYNFVSCFNNKIFLGKKNLYTFYFSTLHAIRISGSKVGELQFHNCNLEDVLLEDIIGERIEVRKCIFSLRAVISKVKLDKLYISDSLVTHVEKDLRFNDNYQLRLEESEIHWVRFFHNTFETTLKINGVEIKELDISSNVFYTCPIIFTDITKNLRNIDLPETKSFKFDFYPEYSLLKKSQNNPRLFNTAWNQYKRFLGKFIK